MKKYIIMSYDIHPLGGCQNYIYGKSIYLEQKGWQVYVLFAGVRKGDFAFKYLSKFADGNFAALEWIPSHLPTFLVNHVINSMTRLIGYDINDECVLESHHDKTHLWGELLASRLHAKHVCFNCNELFRGPDKFFEPYLDFYKFKLDRSELFGITSIAVNRLFEGRCGVPNMKRFVFLPKPPDAVQDIEADIISDIPNADWSICYIGRIIKNYVDNIITSVGSFAQKHSDKSINFVIVGDAEVKKNFIENCLGHLGNVKIVYLGNQVPIPKSLFSKLDVIIAGSGCAMASVREHVPIIIPSPETCLSNGLFRYENISSVDLDPGRKNETFVESLEKVLVERIHEKLEFHPFEYEYLVSASEAYDVHMQLISSSAPDNCYYPAEIISKNIISKLLSFKNAIRYTLSAIRTRI